MILYCETSALIKRYVEEDGSDKVDELWEKAGEIAFSTIAFAEAIAAFRRRWRDGLLSEREYTLTITQFKDEYPRFILVPITVELNQIIEELVLKYPLQGFDAIHLGSALMIHRGTHLFTVFACFDPVLNRAAKEEGLDVPFLSNI